MLLKKRNQLDTFKCLRAAATQVHCEAPNDKVNDFTGQLRLETKGNKQLKSIVTEENVMLWFSFALFWTVVVVVVAQLSSSLWQR